MARTQQYPRKLALIITLLAVFLLISGTAAFLLLRKPDEFAKLPAFPIDSYINGKTSLWSHEDYKLEGRVDNVISRSPGGEKLLVAIEPSGSMLRLPVVIKNGSGKAGIQREQKLVLRVNLGQGSEIVCVSYAVR